jgi:hypothetical protein
MKAKSIARRQAAALRRGGIIVLFVAIPISALLFTYILPINEFGAELIRWADFPNLILVALFDQWMTVESKLFWQVVSSTFPLIVWGVAGLLVAQRI